MFRVSFQTTILLLLSLLTGAGQTFAPLLASLDDTQPFFLNELSEGAADSDETEDLSEGKLSATVDRNPLVIAVAGFHAVCMETLPQLHWLFIFEHSARAPPAG